MSQKKKFIVMASLIALITGIVYMLLRYVAGGVLAEITQDVRFEQATTSVAILHEQAPTFSLPTLQKTARTLEEMRGEPLVLTFWTTWNSASSDQLALFDAIDLSKYPGVRLIAVNVQEDRSIVENFLARAGYRTEVLLDETGVVAGSYRAYSLPATYFIDRRGTIQSIILGVLTEGMMQGGIESIIVSHEEL